MCKAAALGHHSGGHLPSFISQCANSGCPLFAELHCSSSAAQSLNAHHYIIAPPSPTARTKCCPAEAPEGKRQMRRYAQIGCACAGEPCLRRRLCERRELFICTAHGCFEIVRKILPRRDKFHLQQCAFCTLQMRFIAAPFSEKFFDTFRKIQR